MNAERPPLDLRLVPAALTSWAVTAAGIIWPVGAVPAAAASIMLAVLLRRFTGRLAAAEPDRPIFGTAGVLAVAMVAAAFAVSIGLRSHDVRHHPVTARIGTTVTVTVTPAETPRVLAGGRLLFRAALRELAGAPADGAVTVFAPAWRGGEVTAGRPTTFRARVGRPTRADLTVAVLTAIGEPTVGRTPTVPRLAGHIRSAFAAIARLVLPVDQAAMLPALVLGDTSMVSASAASDFRTAGLTHLTAVSGANVTIVCGTALLSAALIGPRLAAVLAFVVLVAFVIVVEPSASVLRAAVMGGIGLLAMVSHRRRQAIPVLACSVIALMVGAPALAVDVGFALSVVATAALVLIAPAWSQRLTDRGWPRPLAAAVSVAVAAQLVTAPLVAGITGRFSVLSVLANLVVAAVIPPITVIGTAAAVLAAWWPTGAGLLIRFTGPELWWLLQVAHRVAAVPGATVPVPSGPVGVVVVAAGGLALVLGWRRRWVRLLVALGGVGLLAWTVSGVVGPA
ncbi:ComEC/Rec2-like protein [Mycolicibacterium canariasense]|uniref:ComEC/Rec2-like protein n=1 Tax=Mycolicibacterium canariasense TaxID=228230 RepID=A0A100W9M5_MYCCR|nr:ComEC/Rec2 family competence protein [Mycolicibacterium canariasense]MCV7210299.1 ComEC/Rec2 family competence protein [Mycolicibacterium canariasense]ORV04408.1 competence protein [Mycolicibacterium canariasense]GAS94090.1 ComEC/Rec2-like protein [Mycolicibacterium canariasense]